METNHIFLQVVHIFVNFMVNNNRGSMRSCCLLFIFYLLWQPKRRMLKIDVHSKQRFCHSYTHFPTEAWLTWHIVCPFPCLTQKKYLCKKIGWQLLFTKWYGTTILLINCGYLTNSCTFHHSHLSPPSTDSLSFYCSN